VFCAGASFFVLSNFYYINITALLAFCARREIDAFAAETRKHLWKIESSSSMIVIGDKRF